MTTGLILQSVTISIGQRALISNLDLTVRPGSVVTVMGPSGSGKSTLISFIGGHLEPAFRATGQVLIDNRNVTQLPPERRGIGILFQDDLLFPHLSVGANLAFGLASGVDRASRRDRVNEALAEADLEGFYDRDPATLGRPPSGGPVWMLVHAWSWRYGRGGRRSWSGLRSRPQDRFWCGGFIAQR
jgi:putative thiamine transport system ATP-binding protein